MAKAKKQGLNEGRNSCRSCGEELASSATLCQHCGMHQKPWKARLQFLASVVGVMSLALGVIAYTPDAWSKVRQLVAWKSDVRVLKFDSSKDLTALNAGDGPVVLSHVSIELPVVGMLTIGINKRLERSESTTVEFSSRNEGLGRLINHASAGEWMHAVRQARYDGKAQCITAVVFSANHPDYEMYIETDRRDPHEMPQLPATAILHFYDLKTGPGRTKIPAHGLLFRRQDCLGRGQYRG